MGGIINYYHGEKAKVLVKVWVPGDNLTLRLELGNNQHRRYAHDYGTDIGIDPAVAPGEDVVYLRLDATCGIWLSDSSAFEAGELLAAIKRVLANRTWMQEYERVKKNDVELRSMLRSLESQTGVRLADDGESGQAAERSPTNASIFISYSSKNRLMAREIYEDLRADAGLEIWFDLAESGNASSVQHLTQWLRSAVHSCRGLILLLTEAAADSAWVQQEISWAEERAVADPAFRIVVLRLADVRVPDLHAHVIDCAGLPKVNGINEELFAALFDRCGRREWLEAVRPHRLPTAADGEVFQYEDFASDGGRALEFDYEPRGDISNGSTRRSLSWRLVYQSGNNVITVTGRGEDEPIDLGIRRGDQVGYFTCRHRGGTQLGGVRLWMRTDQIDLSSDTVLNSYYEALGADILANDEIIDRFLEANGWDIYGRLLADFKFRLKDGRVLGMPKVMWMTFKYVRDLDTRLGSR